jgi:alkylation response protein AidB-like acyl-CoA dehydrogenase
MTITKEYYKMLTPEFKYPKVFCTEEEIMMAKTIREFTEKEIMPKRHDLEGGWHKNEELALTTLYELYSKGVKLGLTTSNLPAEYGGGGLSPIVRSMINEELGRGDIGFATLIGKIHWIVSIMLAAKRDDLLKEFAPKLTGGEPWIACVAITEPAGGANLEDASLGFKTIRTIVKEDGGDYVINGHKIWPGPGGPAEHFLSTNVLKGHLGYWTVATFDPNKGRDGVTVIYVPPDAKGLSFSTPYQKMGFSWTEENVEIFYDNVRVPKKYRIDSKPGEGADIVEGYIIGLGRLAGSARLVGLSEAVLEIVLEFTANRIIAGKPERERSMFAGLIAEIFRGIDIARQYYLSVTWQAMHPELYGPPYSKEMFARFCAARSFAGDVAEFATNRGMELMGSYGYSYDFHLEKYMRDYKIVKMWLGGAQRDRLDIAQGLYGPFKWAGDIN